MKDDPILDLFRGASVVAVFFLTLVLLFFLPRPGYQTSRLVLFAVVLFVGWVGAAGAIFSRSNLLVAGAVGQFLLGFWNFTIGVCWSEAYSSLPHSSSAKIHGEW
ncbi:hypothetical protein [Halospeciosus flavus]|uniref:Uncharacterized protein n=1 Tax=Halospeciosus flavus TaxID=3032283 RepID=A0ABD5Z3J5_9EURY|nr:hypothetical protein [Halospeciosus flavus]